MVRDTAIRNKRVILARIVLAIFGCAAVAWGATVFPMFWRQSSIQRMATQIISGARLKTEGVLELLPAVQALERSELCRPNALWNAAIIRLYVLEASLATAERAAIDEQENALDGTIRRSLACVPADPFLWLALFSLESAQNGIRPKYLEYLRRSYRLGPNEGWIALRRNPSMLAIFEELPPDVADRAVTEFVGLVESGFYDEAVAILIGPGWKLRDLLVARLKDVGERHRQSFAKRLYAQDQDITVPGVERPESRPWR
jgi:hypothetical protein